jgi:hypothetical protein
MGDTLISMTPALLGALTLILLLENCVLFRDSAFRTGLLGER